MECISFPPLANPDARLLILGSMPGIASLQAQQYYAHPQNLFWKIIGPAVDFDPASAYEQRTARLVSARVAVWDVLQSCVRKGSLDVDIDKSSTVPNDFAAFFAAHPRIERVCFNGAAAATLFMKQVQPHLPVELHLQYVRLPSTSPANASIPREEKIQAWSAALRFD